MDGKYLLGILTGALVCGAYVTGLFQGHRRPLDWGRFFASMTARLTRNGFVWALSLPIGWVLFYYAFVAHVRLSLGRWPRFGENLTDWALATHYRAIELGLQALVLSLVVAAVILAVCLFSDRWRHVSVYALCYGAGVGAAFGCCFLAPHPFLNWFLD